MGAPGRARIGAGDALVGELVSWARTEGARVVRLDVTRTNMRARHFYERNGFRLTGQEKVRERDREIELQMEALIAN